MKVKILFALVVFLTITIGIRYLFINKSIPIPVSYPSQYNYHLEISQEIVSDKIEMSVLFFTSNNCAPCIKMKKLVWSDEKVEKSVGEYNKSPHILNSANQKDIDSFATHSIKYVPTTIIIDSDGEEVKRSVGYMGIQKLLDFLN